MHRSAAVGNVGVVAALWALAFCALAQPLGAVTTSLTVKGSVERELTLTVDDRSRKAGGKNADGFRRSVVIATASDGYRAVFSSAELYLPPSATARSSSMSAPAFRSKTAKAVSRSSRSRTLDRDRGT